MINISTRFLVLLSAIASITLYSCSTAGPSGLFGKKTPHEQYGDKLKQAGLESTALGRQWFDAAQKSLQKPLQVVLPYSETGYFSAGKPTAAGVVFSAKRGQKISIGLIKKPVSGFAVYVELWQPAADNNQPKLLASVDTLTNSLSYEIKQEGDYQLRLQPELLQSGEYTLTVSTGPSLGFPVSADTKSNIGSFWGAGRDGGQRSHEGIDIFVPKRTPVVAAAPGTVTRVNENILGGKVVFMTPHDRDYTLYYAHLDEQIAKPGDEVQTGDTLGLVGNTGNARSTAPHLHFGIYTNGGAVDPFPFVNREVSLPSKISAPLSLLNEYAKTTSSTNMYQEPGKTVASLITLDKGTVLQVQGATAQWYKVHLLNGEEGFVDFKLVKPLTESTALRINQSTPLLDAPGEFGLTMATLKSGDKVEVLGKFNQYSYVRKEDRIQGWVRM